MNMPAKGEIWDIDWSPGRGSEQTGTRPAIIVQRDAGNQNPQYPNTIVVTVSSKGRPLPFHVALSPTPQNGLTVVSFVKCEQILTIDKARLIRKRVRISPEEIVKIDDALRIVLDI